VDDPKYHALFRFLYASGCRIGEALALSRADIQGRSVRINKTLSIRTESANWKITTPKNKYSVRTIDLPQSVVDELLDLPQAKFLFFAAENNPLHPNSVQNALKKYERVANVTPIRIHDFRHSHASFLLSSGIPITAVSKRLGHKNAQITLQIYAHSLPSDNDAISSALERI
jgi:integrase